MRRRMRRRKDLPQGLNISAGWQKAENVLGDHGVLLTCC